MSANDREPVVMIVDDVPENLTLLGAILRRQKYQVEIITNGASALKTARQYPPDIILLDISMPEMDGYEVCQRLKADENLSHIPVIFISALHQSDEKIKAFEVGGQDYITKPFEVSEVKERVRTHLELAWTRRELEETLDQTLTGSLKLITDFMGFVNPTAFSRGIRIKQNMTAIAEQLELVPKRWFELAAVLSQFGLAAVSPAVQEKYSLRRPLTGGEKEEIEESIELIATMLKSIPRLETVSAMICNHKLTVKQIGKKPFEALEIAEQGGMILNLLQQYDQLALKGKLSSEIIQLLRKDQEFPEVLYEALRLMDKAGGDWQTRCNPLSELVSGMILEEDVMDIDGRVLLKRGVKFSDTIINALKMERNRLAKKTFMVKTIPTLD